MTALPHLPRVSALVLALTTAFPLHAQTHAGHQQSDDPHAQHQQRTNAEPTLPHAAHRNARTNLFVSSPFKGEAGRGMVVPDDQDEATPSPPNPPLEEAAQRSEGNHSQMDHSSMAHGTQAGQTTGHEGHVAADQDLPANAPPRTPIPLITATDRAAAFGPTNGHAAHDKRIHYYVLANRLETWDADEGSAFGWEASAWIGGDLNRLWVRSEGESIDGEIESANVELFYGRAIARWWDAVVGIRHDFGPSEGAQPSQTFAAIGVMGVAPYKFEVEATAYLGESGQAGLGVEAEYETLFTNRLVGQWLVEAEAWGQDDIRRGIGSGLGTVEAGFRLRYEFDRQFAPYLGVVWERAYGDTADLRRADGHAVEDTRIVVGLRTWF